MAYTGSKRLTSLKVRLRLRLLRCTSRAIIHNCSLEFLFITPQQNTSYAAQHFIRLRMRDRWKSLHCFSWPQSCYCRLPIDAGLHAATRFTLVVLLMIIRAAFTTLPLQMQECGISQTRTIYLLLKLATHKEFLHISTLPSGNLYDNVTICMAALVHILQQQRNSQYSFNIRMA